jgi:hypothetical protein
MNVNLARVLVFIAAGASMLGMAGQVHSAGRSALMMQGGVALENVEALYRFGEQVVFRATIRSSVPVQSGSITVLDHKQNLVQSSPLIINPDGTTQFFWDARGIALRPFTVVYWRYDLSLADGKSFQSEAYSFRYDDNRFDWQALDSGALRVRWMQGDAAFAQRALTAALEGFKAINAYFPVDLSQPVEVFIYPSQNDLQFLGNESWVVGLAEPSSGVALVALEPVPAQDPAMRRHIPHELMHVMMYRHLGEGYENIPAWLREGMATLVEIDPTLEYERVVTNAAAREALIPLLDLCASFPSQPDSAFLAYAQARSFTLFLRDTFGVPKLLDLSRAYAGGATCEAGVEVVYGLTLMQLELDWRQSALGQDPARAALQNTLPYLVLLCVMLVVPLAIGLTTMRKKKK